MPAMIAKLRTKKHAQKNRPKWFFRPARPSFQINCRVRCAYQSRALAVRLAHEHRGATMVRTAYPSRIT